MKEKGIIEMVDLENQGNCGCEIIEKELKETYEKLNLVTYAMSNANEGIIFTDSTGIKVIYVNDSFIDITGCSKKELEVVKVDILKLILKNEGTYNSVIGALKTTGVWQGEISSVRNHNEDYTAEVTIRTIKDNSESITNYIAIIDETTHKKKDKERIKYLTTYSSLTDLPNRKVFEGRMNKVIEISRDDEKVALLMIDLDNFKAVNENFGFNVGDKLLKAVGCRIKKKIKDEDLLAYLGEDHFGVYLKEIKDIKEVIEIGEKINNAISFSYVFDHNVINITCSIGICIFPDEGSSSDELIARAEKAIVEAKKTNVNSIQLYTKEMANRITRRAQIETDLKSCISNNELFLVYQPQISLVTGKIVGVEALVRWKHNTLGYISPMEFISIAEDTGDILPIGQWVLTTACNQAKLWQDKGLSFFKISVNLSPIQLRQKNIFNSIMSTIENIKVDPKTIEIEITEGTMMEDMEKAISILNKLKKQGIQIAIDDFGTGYSSLGYLRKIPIDKLKIDRSFITNFNEDFEGSIITKTIIDMAKNLGYKVIAEGAETKEQIEYLRSNGCDEVQGYYYSKPLLPDELEKYIKELDIN
jgi:diguanylate cyclase (GGDEF)-like protein/PAS domain S-box-containing protein